MQTIGDWRQLAKALDRLADLDTQALGAEIGEGLLTSTKRRFKEGRGPDGQRWPKSARAKAQGGQTLVQRRRLERSITYKAQARRVELGTNDKRADVHQQGKVIKARRAKALRFKVPAKSGRTKWAWVMVKQVKMPARPFIGLSQEDQAMIGDIIQAELEERLR